MNRYLSVIFVYKVIHLSKFFVRDEKKNVLKLFSDDPSHVSSWGRHDFLFFVLPEQTYIKNLHEVYEDVYFFPRV